MDLGADRGSSPLSGYLGPPGPRCTKLGNVDYQISKTAVVQVLAALRRTPVLRGLRPLTTSDAPLRTPLGLAPRHPNPPSPPLCQNPGFVAESDSTVVKSIVICILAHLGVPCTTPRMEF